LSIAPLLVGYDPYLELYLFYEYLIEAILAGQHKTA